MRDEAFRSSRRAPGLLCIFASLAILALSISPVTRADLPGFLESARLQPIGGAPEGGFGRAIAIDGDRAVVTANQGSYILDTTPEEIGAAAYVFERDAGGEWHQTAKLVPDAPVGLSGLYGYSVALEGDVIVVGAPYMSAAHIYEYSGTGWVNTTSLTGPGFGISVAIENGVIGVSSNTPHGMRLFQRQGGAWTQIATFANGGNAGGSNYMGPNVDVTADRAIHWSPGDNLTDPELPEEVYIYSRPAGGDWNAATVKTLDRSNINRHVKISGDAAVIGGAVYERYPNEPYTGEWGAAMGDVASDIDSDIDGTLVVTSSIVRERAAFRYWPLVARLVASDSYELGRSRLSGRRVVASRRAQQDEAAAYVFDIPEDPQETFLQPFDFEDAQSGGWNVLTGNFSVMRNDASWVFRQGDDSGNATSMLTSSYGRNQSVHGFITPRAFNGADRWFGLAVRYTDASNHYYITVRSSQQIQLKKIVGGVVQTLASAPMPVAVNRGYNLRLEANATRLRVFVDDRLLFDVTDSALLQGYSGIMMYKTRADIDNIVLGSNPGTTHFSTGFETGDPNVAGANGWQVVTVDGSQVISTAATATSDSARSTGSPHYNATAVSVQARATQFDGADRWFGLALRYMDAQNYHYITVRDSDTILLRKLVNGVPQTLDSAPLPVTLNSWYRLRLAVIDQKLVVYVNNDPVLEAYDPALLSMGNMGRAALLTYKAVGQFDDFHVFGY